MADKLVGLSGKAFEEIVEDYLNWQEAAQALAYLIGGTNGHGAEETLRLGRVKLAKLFETLEHDAVCWREIADRPEASEYIRAFAQGRAEALKGIADKAHERFQLRHK